MLDVFSMLEHYFDNDTTLKTYGRKVYDGYQDEEHQSVLPCIEVVNISQVPLDSFGFDGFTFILNFAISTSRTTSTHANIIIKALMRVFDDKRLPFPTGAYAMIGMHLQNITGPILEQGKYKALVVFRLMVERSDART